MEINAKEVAAVEVLAEQIQSAQADELSLLQLALVGGGCGEVLFG